MQSWKNVSWDCLQAAQMLGDKPSVTRIRFSQYGEEPLVTEEDMFDHEKQPPNLLLVPMLPSDIANW